MVLEKFRVKSIQGIMELRCREIHPCQTACKKKTIPRILQILFNVLCQLVEGLREVFVERFLKLSHFRSQFEEYLISLFDAKKNHVIGMTRIAKIFVYI